MSPAMHVLLCPDSFKGSLSSPAVANAMIAGIRQVDPQATTEAIAMADGGEGMSDIINTALNGQWRAARVHAPDGQWVMAGWGWDPVQRQAILDVASACGLDLVPEAKRDPWQLDTRGVGELILAALDAGATRILIGLGGSGTNDAGAGMLAALGAVFMDASGRRLAPSPAALADLARVDLSLLDARLPSIKLDFLTDVDNPLTGAQGASAVFGPQKGLSPNQVAPMDARLFAIARRIEASRPLRCDIDSPGMGAAGGLGFALGAVLGGARQMGSRYIADLVGLDAAIHRSDLVITGEGCLDGQTARGKVVAEVVRRANGFGKPVLAIAGSVNCTPEQIHEIGLAGALSLSNKEVSIAEAIARPAELITERTAQAFHQWALARGHNKALSD
ncbi:MAG: glycerate kinase [Halothiobacillaceae bacterium]|nr:glycerate kinase [Halothiobacillaceae bacterium]